MEVSVQTAAFLSHTTQNPNGNGATPGANTEYTRYYGTGEKSESPRIDANGKETPVPLGLPPNAPDH